MKPTALAQSISQYLTFYLTGTKGLSSNTIASRRDTFILLFQFLKVEKKMDATKVVISDLGVELILDFLNWIEIVRKCSISTRNIRLSGIKAFFQYIQTQTPDYMHISQQILSIQPKKCPEEIMEYLTLDGIKAILDAVDTRSFSGRRDLVRLSVLYDSGARVQEIADLIVGDVRLQNPATVRLTGKGNKKRIVPLMKPTVQLLQQYLNENHLLSSENYYQPVFSNRSKSKLTRAGIAYILDKYVCSARNKAPLLVPEKVSPHSLRHSKAMHLLQSGVPLIYIRDYLGHSEIATTEIYARCDTKQKRKALETAYTVLHNPQLPAWEKDEDLMQWLKSLC